MPSQIPRRRSAGRARLIVNLTAPDGASLPTRGLAAWLANLAPASVRGEVTVALVSDARMRTLNRSYRNKDYATDVLSFPAFAEVSTSAKVTAVRPTGKRGSTDERASKTVSAAAKRQAAPLKTPTSAEPRYLGDIVIATGVAQRQADEVGHPVAIEIKVLALHGLLHLLGYDHDTDTGEMARMEARLRKKAGLTDSLIARQSR